MAKKFKLNKSELTRLKREEKTYRVFLPVLKLKQEQLQLEQLRLKRQINLKRATLEKVKQEIQSLICLLPEKTSFDLKLLLSLKKVHLAQKSIAGVKVPTLDFITYPKVEPSFFLTAPWIIRGLPILCELDRQNCEIKILEVQYRHISVELRKSTQKVNLFEKVLIPEANAAIKKIKISLGDEQVAQVGRGKLAKKMSAVG